MGSDALAHLHPSVRALADLDNEQRLRIMQRDRWIDYPCSGGGALWSRAKGKISFPWRGAGASGLALCPIEISHGQFSRNDGGQIAWSASR